MHPPHSTVLRREKRKRDPYTADRQKLTSFLISFIIQLISLFLCIVTLLLPLCYLFSEVTTWPRMDNDPPGSWNGVVHTPLRKLWVQVQRVATSLRQVRIPRSAIRELLSPLVVTLVPLYPPTVRPQLTTHRRPLAGPLRPGGGAGAGSRGGPEPSRETPRTGVSRDPPEGVRDPPKRGGAGILNNVNFGGFHRS